MVAAMVAAQPMRASQVAFFADESGAYPASFAWSGSCNGPMTLTLAIHRPAGDDVRVVQAKSVMQPDMCYNLQCLDCPPVPGAFVWVVTGLASDVALAGGGPTYYDHYSDHVIAWSLQGPFMEGALTVAGILA
jgi:hypothetical protein